MKQIILCALLFLNCTKEEEEPLTVDQVIEMMEVGIKIVPKDPATSQPEIATLAIYCMYIYEKDDADNYNVYVNNNYLWIVNKATLVTILNDRIIKTNLYNILKEPC